MTESRRDRKRAAEAERRTEEYIRRAEEKARLAARSLWAKIEDLDASEELKAVLQELREAAGAE